MSAIKVRTHRKSKHQKKTLTPPPGSLEPHHVAPFLTLRQLIDNSFDSTIEQARYCSSSEQREEPVSSVQVNQFLQLPKLHRFFEYRVVRQIGTGFHYDYFIAIDANNSECFLKKTRGQDHLPHYHREARFCDIFFGKGRQKTKYGNFLTYQSATKNLVPLVRKFSDAREGWLLYQQAEGHPILHTLLMSKTEIINEEQYISYRLKPGMPALSGEIFFKLARELIQTVNLFHNEGVVHAALGHQKILAHISKGELKKITILPSSHSFILKPISVDEHPLQHTILPSIAYFKHLGLENMPTIVLNKISRQKALKAEDLAILDRWMVGNYLYEVLTLTPYTQSINITLDHQTFKKGPLAGCIGLKDLVRKHAALHSRMKQHLKRRIVWPEVPREEASRLVAGLFSPEEGLERLLERLPP